MKKYFKRALAHCSGKRYLGNETGIALVGALIIAIALFALIGVAVSATGMFNSTLTAEKSSTVSGSLIVQQGGYLRNGFAVMLANNLSISEVTFDNASSTGLFNPTDGGAIEQIPIASSLITGTNTYVYKVDASKNPVVKIKGIGIDANADYMVALVDLKKGVCEQINKSLYGSTTIPAPAAAANTSVNWNSAATAIDLSAEASVDKKSEACIQTTDAKYVYYKTVVEK